MIRSTTGSRLATALTAALLIFTTAPAASRAATLTYQTNLQLWLKADAGVTTSAGLVTSWQDQSPNNLTASPGGISSRPALLPGVLNGNPVVKFDGSDDYLSVPHDADLNVGTGGFSMFAVFNHTQNANVTYPYGLVYGKFNDPSPFAGPQVFADLFGTGVVSLRIDSGNRVDSTPLKNDGRFRVWDFLRTNPTTLQEYIDGSLEASATVASVNTDSTEPSFIMGRPGGVQPVNGALAELLFYNAALSTADRQAVEQYLLEKYALPEPASMGLLFVAGALMLRRKHARLA